MSRYGTGRHLCRLSRHARHAMARLSCAGSRLERSRPQSRPLHMLAKPASNLRAAYRTPCRRCTTNTRCSDTGRPGAKLSAKSLGRTIVDVNREQRMEPTGNAFQKPSALLFAEIAAIRSACGRYTRLTWLFAHCTDAHQTEPRWVRPPACVESSPVHLSCCLMSPARMVTTVSTAHQTLLGTRTPHVSVL